MAALTLPTPAQAFAREALLYMASRCRDQHPDVARAVELAATDGIPQDMAEEIDAADGYTIVLHPLGPGTWGVHCCWEAGECSTWLYAEDGRPLW